MPYIKSNDGRRQALQKGSLALTAGELNYEMFYYIKHQAPPYDSERVYYVLKSMVVQFLGENPNYQKYNDMTGALIRCAFEIERRMPEKKEATDILLKIMLSYNDEINKYEDLKIQENTDVE